MAFTSGNDLNILQATDSTNIGAGEGDDMYIITSSTMSAGQTINISDTNGQNTLKLIGGVTVTSSVFASNATQLTLNNGAIINVFEADNFNYLLGGNAFSATEGTQVNFIDFAQLLGIPTLPVSGTSIGRENININDNGTITGAGGIVNLDIGSTLNSNVTATQEAEVFYFDQVSALATADDTQVFINGFNTELDSLRFDIAIADSTINTLDQLEGTGISATANVITNEILINFGSDANGDVITLTLSGLTDPSAVNIELV